MTDQALMVFKKLVNRLEKALSLLSLLVNMRYLLASISYYRQALFTMYFK